MMYRELSAYFAAPVVAFVLLRLLPILWTPLLYLSALLGLAGLCVLVLGSTLLSLYPNNSVAPAGKAALITGCDTGFGHSLALRLDRLGYQVFAGCLFPDGVGAKTLKTTASSRLHVLHLDVTKDDHFQDALSYVRQNLGDNVLWALVANAGIFLPVELEWVPMEDVHKTFDVNVYGCLRAVKTFLPLLRESKGRIVLVASLAGRTTTTWCNVYSMTKHAVVSLADGLRREMFKWGITVSMVEPTYYKTAILPTQEAMLKKYNSAPEEVREAYGEDYAKAEAKRYVTIMDVFSRENIGEVLDALGDAVCSLHPKSSYKCDGFFNWLGVWLLVHLPSVFLDTFDHSIYDVGYRAGEDGKLTRMGRFGGVLGKLKAAFLPQNKHQR